MAFHLRRALASNNSTSSSSISLLLRFIRSPSRYLSTIPSFSNSITAPQQSASFKWNSDVIGFSRRSDFFFFGNCRNFAKGKKSKGQNDGDTVQVVPDIGPTVKSTATSQMEAAIVALSRELSKLRSGRASAGMLDHIIVETDGIKLPLNRIAVVSVMDAQTLSVTPYDSNNLKALENAIISSPLGINPTPDGQRLIAAIPPLTKENIQALCKIVAKSAEDVKQSIRRARQKALDSIKKAASSVPKDDAKRLEKEVDDMTKRFIKTIDDMCKAKEKEISGS